MVARGASGGGVEEEVRNWGERRGPARGREASVWASVFESRGPARSVCAFAAFWRRWGSSPPTVGRWDRSGRLRPCPALQRIPLGPTPTRTRSPHPTVPRGFEVSPKETRRRPRCLRRI